MFSTFQGAQRLIQTLKSCYGCYIQMLMWMMQPLMWGAQPQMQAKIRLRLSLTELWIQVLLTILTLLSAYLASLNPPGRNRLEAKWTGLGFWKKLISGGKGNIIEGKQGYKSSWVTDSIIKFQGSIMHRTSKGYKAKLSQIRPGLSSFYLRNIFITDIFCFDLIWQVCG